MQKVEVFVSLVNIYIYSYFCLLFLLIRLDRENIDEYKLTVLAVDSGTPRLTASAAVIVDVLDVDDNPPIFQDDDLYYSIREDAEINTSIALVLLFKIKQL